MAFLDGWTDSQSETYRKQITTFQHTLGEIDLFSDEALIELLDRHPRHLLDVNTMSNPDHPVFPNRFRTGDCRDIEGEHLMAAAKAGRIFINLRNAMNEHAEYKTILDGMYAELEAQTGKRARSPKGGILISSPISKTPYHFDKSEVILWHIRGKKRISIYPREQKFIPATAHEIGIATMHDDDLPYDRSFDKDATVIDLTSNMGVSWPLNSPHRVDNQSFCVSVTTEYSTAESVMKNANFVTNAALRSRLGLSPSYENDSQFTRVVKSFAGQVIKRTSFRREPAEKDLVSFRVDPNEPDFIADITPFERNF